MTMTETAPAKSATETKTAIDPKEVTRDLIGKMMTESFMGRGNAPKPPEEKPVKAEKVVAKVKEPEKPEEEVKPVEVAHAEEKEDKISVSHALRDVGRVVKEAIESSRVEPKPEPKVEGFKLPAEEQELQDNLAALEKLYPAQYKGKAAEREKFLKRQLAYEQKWLEENPGKDFDPNAEEHNELFAEDPMTVVDARHLAKAIAVQIAEAERKKTDERIAELEVRTRTLPLAERESASAAAKTAFEVGGKEAAGIVNPDGSINDDKYQEMLAQDPERARVIASAAYTTKAVVGEMVKIFNDVAPFNPKEDPAHAELARIWGVAESRLAAIDAAAWAKSDARGRKLENFVPYDEFYKLAPSKRAGKWSLDAQDLKEIVPMQVREDAKKRLTMKEESFEAEAKRRGYRLESAAKESKPNGVSKLFSATADDEKPDSPSSSSEPKLAGVKGVKQGSTDENENILMKAWLGR